MANSKKSPSERSQQRVAPNFVVIALDESRYFRDSEEGRQLLKRSGGKIYSLSLYDSNRHIYIASLTPTYELFTYEYVPARYPGNEDASERLNMEMIELLQESNQVDYYNVRDIDRIDSKYKNELGWNPHDEIPDEDRYDEVLEQYLEYVRGNDSTPKGLWAGQVASNPKSKTYKMPVEIDFEFYPKHRFAARSFELGFYDQSLGGDRGDLWVEEVQFDIVEDEDGREKVVGTVYADIMTGVEEYLTPDVASEIIAPHLGYFQGPGELKIESRRYRSR